MQWLSALPAPAMPNPRHGEYAIGFLSVAGRVNEAEQRCAFACYKHYPPPY
jgi:hypothetical protein